MINLFIRGKAVKRYMIILYALAIVGFLSIALSFVIESEHAKGFLMGLGTSLLLANAINLIVMKWKKRKAGYEEDLELQMIDERIKQNKMKALAYSGLVALFTLCFMMSLYFFYEYNLMIGNVVVLMSYTISIAFFKLRYRNK